MPKSKGRAKKKDRSRPYVPPPAKATKPKKKESPRWYGRLVIGIFALGVGIIVLNYAGKVPFTDGFTPWIIWLGLGIIGVGMFAMTGLR